MFFVVVVVMTEKARKLTQRPFPTVESLRAARTCTQYGNERPVASLNRPCATGTRSESVGTTENSHDFSRPRDDLV